MVFYLRVEVEALKAFSGKRVVEGFGDVVLDSEGQEFEYVVVCALYGLR